jgi:hypothetical protein
VLAEALWNDMEAGGHLGPAPCSDPAVAKERCPDGAALCKGGARWAIFLGCFLVLLPTRHTLLHCPVGRRTPTLPTLPQPGNGTTTAWLLHGGTQPGWWLMTCYQSAFVVTVISMRLKVPHT